MATEKQKITGQRGTVMERTGFFDFDQASQNLKSWFEKREYDFQEKKNAWKHKPDGMEVTIDWEAEREIDDFFKYFFAVTIRLRKVKKKGKGYTGFARVSFETFLELDYEEGWMKKPFHKFLFYVYTHYIITDKIDHQEKALREEVEEFRSVIEKSFPRD